MLRWRERLRPGAPLFCQRMRVAFGPERQCHEIHDVILMQPGRPVTAAEIDVERSGEIAAQLAERHRVSADSLRLGDPWRA
jgi:hypothetical protein